ncbi:MAG: L,D-transpeptidase [Synergistaceae bacterium]|nr:L,D-transpeptidase [Synergistaceae bacterium]
MKKNLAFIMIILIFMVYADKCIASQTWQPKEGETWIGINKEQLRLTLYNGQNPIKTWQISIGKGKGAEKKSRFDLITPSGTFTVYRVVEDATKLVYDPAWFNEPGEPEAGAYGSKLISFYNKWQIAIHGTNNPSSIGRRATHGCIRLRNRDIEELVKDVSPKMKLVIIEKDLKNKFYRETI